MPSNILTSQLFWKMGRENHLGLLETPHHGPIGHLPKQLCCLSYNL